jgi:multisubunit Na+/H+ antiporter MnhB subunit
MRLIRDFIFLVLFFIFLIGWLLAWAAFHVAGGGVHLLIVIAVVFLLIHFLAGRRRAV